MSGPDFMESQDKITGLCQDRGGGEAQGGFLGEVMPWSLGGVDHARE